MYININHTIRINYINFESVNTINNFKEETKIDNASSCLGMYVHEFYKHIGPLPIHLLPTFFRYEIVVDMNHACNNTRISLQKKPAY